MRFLLEPEGEILGAARAAREHGLDGVLLSGGDALIAAATVASAVESILVAAEVPLGDLHPVEIAEQAAVVDVAAAGRLILVVRAAGPDFTEALDVLRLAHAARPFTHRGERWTIPARLPQNTHNTPERARVTPTPFGPRLELWTAGADAAPAGLARGLGHLADAEDRPLAWPSHPASLGAPRARREHWDNPSALLERLRAGRAAFDQDWAVVRAPASAARAIAAEVRPRIQLDSLPTGLEDHWDSAG